MVREDLVEGAVTFLQDPSVAAAPLEQRLSFLRSKNLTQDEIDTSLARVGQASTNSGAPPSVQYRQAPPQYNNGYGQGYPPQWQQPPEQPRRDWRDYFIAATVMGGVGYGLYWTAKRYIVPLISPPTPPQLEQDKASVDSSFDKAFALLDQLASDTKELKEAESSRKERLDNALGEVEAVIGRMKQANDDREQESKRMARELSEIRDSIPRALEKDREAQDARLKELGLEMKSLKTLVANRMQSGGVAPPPRAIPSYSSQSQGSGGHVLGSAGSANAVTASSIPATETSAAPETNGVMTDGTSQTNGSTSAQYAAGASQERSGTPYGRLLGGKPAIPLWQQAAKKKSEEAKADAANSGSSIPNPAESGTVADAIDG